MGWILSVGVAVGNPSPSAKGLQGPPGGGFWKEGLATTQAFGLLRDAFPFCSPQGQSLPFQREVWRDCLCWERPKADPSPSAKGLQGPLVEGFGRGDWLLRRPLVCSVTPFPSARRRGPCKRAQSIAWLQRSRFFCVHSALQASLGRYKHKKRLRYSSKPSNSLCLCGRRGIRTPGSVKINGFQDRRNRPLCHPSSRVQLPVTPSCRAERRGFEPLKRFWRLLTFQASQFNHSCTFPFRADKGR